MTDSWSLFICNPYATKMLYLHRSRANSLYWKWQRETQDVGGEMFTLSAYLVGTLILWNQLLEGGREKWYCCSTGQYLTTTGGVWLHTEPQRFKNYDYDSFSFFSRYDTKTFITAVQHTENWQTIGESLFLRPITSWTPYKSSHIHSALFIP